MVQTAILNLKERLEIFGFNYFLTLVSDNDVVKLHSKPLAFSSQKREFFQLQTEIYIHFCRQNFNGNLRSDELSLVTSEFNPRT